MRAALITIVILLIFSIINVEDIKTVYAITPENSGIYSITKNESRIVHGMINTENDSIDTITFNPTLTKSSQLNSIFAPQQTYPLTGNPNGICATDVDGDGDIDLVTANYNPSGVTILLNNGSGIFDSQYSHYAGYDPFYIISVDIDNDSDNDLIVANGSGGSITILFNNGTGNFSNIDEYAAPKPYSLTSVDIDNDNDLDILTANGSENDISVFYNNGSGQFSTPVQYSTGLESNGISTGDFDNDGDIDVVVAHMNDDKITILTNTGNGTLESAVTYDVGYWPFNIYVDDFNYDGYVDIATANQGSGDVSVLLNSNGNSFFPNKKYAAEPGCNAIAIEDFNQDCTIDFMTANSYYENTTLLLNDGNGFFSSAGSFGAGDDVWSICSADLDGDGDLDVATGNWISKDVSVLMNLTNGIECKRTIPVFLVHGLDDNSDTWYTMKDWLENNNYEHVYSVNNLEPCGVQGEADYSGNASLLATFIDEKVANLEASGYLVEEIDIIAHSMGGLISRRYNSPIHSETTTWTNKSVRNLIMLGTPNKGSNLANIDAILDIKCPSGPATLEMSFPSMILFNEKYSDDLFTTHYSFWGSGGSRNDCYAGLMNFLAQLALGEPNDGAVTRHSATRSDGSRKEFNPYYPNQSGNDWCHSKAGAGGGTFTYLEDVSFFSNYIKPILDGQNPITGNNYRQEVSPDIPPQIIYQTELIITQGTIITDSFYIEPNGDMRVALLSNDSMITFSLESPSSIIFNQNLPVGDPTQVFFTDSLGTSGFYIEGAEEGYWHWTADGSSMTTSSEITVLSGIDNSVILTIEQNLEYLSKGDTLIQKITIADNSIEVLGLSVVALPIWNEVDTSLQISLLDDGLHGDELANDGTYGALIASLDSGFVEYKITVTGAVPSGNINRMVTMIAYSEGSCCINPTGDINNDGGATPDISDLLYLVDYMFLPPGAAPEPACMEETDVNGDGSPVPDISDLLYLVDYMFLPPGGAPAPVDCR